MVKIQLTVIHPLDGTDISIEADSDVTAGMVISKLVGEDWIPYGPSYSLSIEKSNGKIFACGKKEKLEDYEITDGDTLRISVNDGADSFQPSKNDPPFTSDPNGSKVKVLSHNGINFDDLPPFDLKSLLEKMKDSPLSYSMIMLLHEYKTLLEENKQSNMLRENESERIRQGKIKLEDQVKEYERKSGEKKSAAILLAASNVVIALGTAFVTTNVIPSVVVILAGVTMIIMGLWLSFK